MLKMPMTRSEKTLTKTLKTRYNEGNLQQIHPFQGIQGNEPIRNCLCEKGAKFDTYDYNHEHIHLKQMQEMLWVFYYLWYAIEYLIIRFFAKWNKQSERYHDVSFEEEAHNNDHDLEYIRTRKHYSWVKYVKLRSYKK